MTPRLHLSPLSHCQLSTNHWLPRFSTTKRRLFLKPARCCVKKTMRRGDSSTISVISSVSGSYCGGSPNERGAGIDPFLRRAVFAGNRVPLGGPDFGVDILMTSSCG